jgi:dTDP-4-amino-4,6-dideoxygalactose transaminase
MIANHGQSKKYYHDKVGCNSRLDNLQAAVLRIKLKELDSYIINRKAAASYYSEKLIHINDITTPYLFSQSDHVFHQYTLQLSDHVNREDLMTYLRENHIPSMIYYPIPAHKQKMFSNIPASCGKMNNTDWLCSRVISLPMHTELNHQQQDYIIENIHNYFISS